MNNNFNKLFNKSNENIKRQIISDLIHKNKVFYEFF